MLTFFIYIFLPLWILFQAFYIVSLKRKDMSVIDIAWGLSFIVISVSGLVYRMTHSLDIDWLHLIMTFSVFVWGMRLSLYLLIRNIQKGAEDFRYQQFRNDWGDKTALISYFKVFMLQLILSLIVSLPITLTLFNHQSSNAYPGFLILGALIFFLGFLYETVADYQMSVFQKNKAPGQILSKGLWAYSRHPNYFGEIVLWWGIGIYSIALIDLSLLLFVTSMVGPAFINILILKVSGVPFLAEKYKGNEKYKEYIKRTNSLIPTFLTRG